MKALLKKVIAKALEWEGRLILAKYRPKVVGITGSVGKTSAKEAVAAALGTSFRVRKSEKSYNSEFGVPLTLIGRKSAWNSPLGWLRVLWAGLLLIVRKHDYPEWLVLEIGADRPGDIPRLMRWVKLDVAVVTAIPDIPAHIEFFPTKEHLIAEKGALSMGLKEGGVAVLNADDKNVAKLADKFRGAAGPHGRVLTYGFGEKASVRASNERLMYEKREDRKFPEGISFKVDYEGSSVPFRVKGVFGLHHAYTVLPAVAVGVSQGIGIIALAEALGCHVPPPGRMRIVEGIKETVILDDTYNSSPQALMAALDALEKLEVPGRKLAVLGDMLELGEHSIEAHKAAGRRAGEFCGYLVTVGSRAKFFAEGATEAGFSERSVSHFDDAVEAGKALQHILEPGDAVLVKASQAMRLEKAVEEVMLRPERKDELLCRQDEEWVRR